MAIWIPTMEEVALIRAMAIKESGIGATSIVLEPGCRVNIHEPITIESNINILLVTKRTEEGSWDDTDLDYPDELRAFKQGVTLTEDGRAVIDFYIQHKAHGLFGNIVVYYGEGKIKKICGYGSEPTLYTAK